MITVNVPLWFAFVFPSTLSNVPPHKFFYHRERYSNIVNFRVSCFNVSVGTVSNDFRYPNTTFTSQMLVYLGSAGLNPKFLSCTTKLTGVRQTARPPPISVLLTALSAPYFLHCNWVPIHIKRQGIQWHCSNLVERHPNHYPCNTLANVSLILFRRAWPPRS